MNALKEITLLLVRFFIATQQDRKNSRRQHQGKPGEKKAGETMTDRAKNTTPTDTNDTDGKQVEVYESEIYYFLDEYQKKWDVDAHDIDLSRWNAVLIYIYNNAFKGTDKLKVKPYDKKTSNIVSNNNKYNMDILEYILAIYISLCFEYSKEISINGFCALTGINTSEVYRWADNSRPNPQGVKIYKTLNEQREYSLSAKLYSSRGNPVGILGILNRFYGWNMGQPHGNTGTQQQSIEQIQEKYKQLPPTENNGNNK